MPKGKGTGLPSLSVSRVVRELIFYDLHRGQRDAEIEQPLAEQAQPEQHRQRGGALEGPEDQQRAEHSGQRALCRQQPPAADAEAPGFLGDLELQDPVEHDQASEHDAEEHGAGLGPDQKHPAQQEQQDPAVQILLKGQTVEVLGKIAQKLHRAEHRGQNAQQRHEGLGGDLWGKEHPAAQGDQRGRAEQIAHLRGPHGRCGTSMHELCPLFVLRCKYSARGGRRE